MTPIGMIDTGVRVCSVCAIQKGAKWDFTKKAIFEDATCVLCGKNKPVTAVKNWNWPHEHHNAP
jgi:ferredoxin